MKYERSDKILSKIKDILGMATVCAALFASPLTAQAASLLTRLDT
jgi:hypothetical protein